MCGVAAGLSYLHGQGIVHGDVKGRNIVLSDDLEPLLCDFGLSKLADNHNQTTTASTNAGTAPWLSPELLTCEGRKTFASDIYALGMTITEVLYTPRLGHSQLSNEYVVPQVLTGEPPFPTLLSYAAIIKAVAIEGARPGPPFHGGRGLSWLWEIAEWCWEHLPTERPSASDVQILIYQGGQECGAVSQNRFLRLSRS